MTGSLGNPEGGFNRNSATGFGKKKESGIIPYSMCIVMCTLFCLFLLWITPVHAYGESNETTEIDETIETISQDNEPEEEISLEKQDVTESVCETDLIWPDESENDSEELLRNGGKNTEASTAPEGESGQNCVTAVKESPTSKEFSLGGNTMQFKQAVHTGRKLPSLARPYQLKLTARSDKSMLLEWTDCQSIGADIDGYIILRRVGGEKKYKEITKTPAGRNYYYDHDIRSANVNYAYIVLGYKVDPDGCITVSGDSMSVVGVRADSRKGNPYAPKINYSKKEVVEGGSTVLKLSYPSNAFSTWTRWRSDNSEIAAINSRGIVSAKRPGNVLISGRTPNGRDIRCRIIVLTDKSGWLEKDGKRYYCNQYGEPYKNRWIHFSDIDYYYMQSDGSAATGLITVNGEKYIADSKGLVKRVGGFISLDNNTYCAMPGGALYTNRYVFTDKGWAWADRNGCIDFENIAEHHPVVNKELYEFYQEETHGSEDAAAGSCYKNSETAEHQMRLYSWDWFYYGISLMDMYESTHDEKYIKTFITECDFILSQRDSITGTPSMGEDTDCLPLWSDDGYYSVDGNRRYVYPGNQALILYPMMRFCETVRSDSLHDYDDKAMFYLQAAGDALDALRPYMVFTSYDDETGSFRYTNDTNEALKYNADEYNLNMVHAFIMTAGLYDKLAGRNDYEEQIDMTLNNFKKNYLKYDDKYGNAYWAYWPANNAADWEDISHAFLTSFAISELLQRTDRSVVTESDMLSIAKIVGNSIEIKGDKQLVAKTIKRDGSFYDIGKNSKYGGLALWAYASSYDRAVLTYVTDVFSYENKCGKAADNLNGGTVLFKIASILKAEATVQTN